MSPTQVTDPNPSDRGATPGRVLLVDDLAWTMTPFVEAFGDIVDGCSGVAELTRRIERRETWTTAFVDFNLGPDRPCGLNAMMLLQRAVPGIRLAAVSSLSEPGRRMFMAAATRWYQAVIVDKDVLEPAVLRRAADPADNPARPWLRQQLRSAHLVDALFVNPKWLPLWRAWPQFNGSQPSIARVTNQGRSAVRAFAEAVGPVVAEFEAAFGGPESNEDLPFSHSASRVNNKYAAPLSRFVWENRQIFLATDIDQVIDDLHVRRNQAEKAARRRQPPGR